MANPIELHLVRHADTAWQTVIRPWLEAGRGRLGRALVVGPTRGQAHGLKQRCLMEGVPLLGVEFLTPGLARQKWLALAAGKPPVLGRELLLLGLRAAIARRLAPLTAADPAWGFWQSLQSDPARALDDFDELLKGGFRAVDFPLAPLRDVFGELTVWAAAAGATLAPLQAEAAGLAPVPPDAPRIAGRLLVHGLGAEAWGEFFNVVTLARHCAEVTVVLPEPAFRGEPALDEKWVALWEDLLGVEAQTVDAPDPADTCAAVGALWTHDAGDAARARLIVGRTRADEMELVAAEIAALLAAGAENIAVIFPRADAAHLRLARLLAARGVPLADLLETAGPPPADVQVQRALLAFHTRGARLEELLDLWPRLRALGLVTQPLAAARDVCERIFDEGQTHALAAHVERLQASTRPAWREVARVAELLLPLWPETLTLSDALERFARGCEALGVEAPEGWPALRAWAARMPDAFPAAVMFATLESLLPATAPVASAPGRGCFARVTLTTRRRAEGLAWSHVIFVESNAGGWPERREPSCWLTDEQRAALNARGRFTLGLFTSEDRAMLDRQGAAALARDTRERVVFSAALHDEEEPEVRLAPNSWVERVMMHRGLADGDGGLEAAFAREARAVVPPPAADDPKRAAWLAVGRGRHDPARKFDEYFFGGDPAAIAPDRLPARLIERGVQDPAELWFEAVLRAQRVPWEPLVRAKAKALGQFVHGLLAAALRPAEVSARGLGELPAQPAAAAALAAALAALRARWPADRYWDSFHAELAHAAAELLAAVYALDAGGYAGTELRLPPAAELAAGAARVPVSGRMDLVRLDRSEWAGARVDVIDFKTGGDARLSAKRMARDGGSLQLAIYLAAVRSLGAAEGRVWMLKPAGGAPTALTLADLPVALTLLGRLEKFLATGVYGALTRDRSPFAAGGAAWPLACPPVPQAVLRAKFAATFGEDADGEAAGDE